jgi:thiol-disulfide isomerase/thioredoxin
MTRCIITIPIIVLCLGLLAGAQSRGDSSSRARAARDKYAFNLAPVDGGDKVEKSALFQDKPLVLFVWAPDCPACLRHMPYAEAIYGKLNLEQVNFMSLAMSDSERDVRDVIKDKHLTFPTLWSGSGSVGDGFDYDGWPTTYVFRKGGKLQEMVESTGTQYFDDVETAVASALK